MIGIGLSLVLFAIGIMNNNQWIGLIDIGLSIIFYIIGTYHYRWIQMSDILKQERKK